MTPRRTVATPRALPPECRSASTSARLSAPWQVAWTIDVAREAEPVAQREELLLSTRRRACTCAPARRETRARAEHVAVRVDRARRHPEARRRRGRDGTASQPGVIWKSIAFVRSESWVGRRDPAARRSRGRDRRAAQSMYLRPAFASGSRILYMSSPSTPAASCLPLVRLVRLARRRRVGRLLRDRRGNDDHAVVVGDHHVAGVHQRAGADHRDVHRAERGLDGALGADRAREHRELHRGEVLRRRARRRR